MVTRAAISVLGALSACVFAPAPAPAAGRADVAALQVALRSAGTYAGTVDGVRGPATVAGVRAVQRRARLAADGVAGARTRRALGAAPPRSPVRLLRPVRGVIGGGFGPRGDRFHAGLDLPAPQGTPVTTAGFGRVMFSGYDAGWGNFVVIGHRFGLRTLYAHLSSIHVATGERVGAGQRLGRVGSTGRSAGPHLHFEVLLRGASTAREAALG